MKTQYLSLLAGVFLCFTMPSYAQTGLGQEESPNLFVQNTNIISAGVGFGRGITSYAYANGWSSSFSPCFMLSYDHSFISNCGIGAAITYATGSENSPTFMDMDPNTGAPVSYTEKWKVTALGFLIRGTYHIHVSSKIDPYVGIGGGYLTFIRTFSTTDPYLETSPLYRYAPGPVQMGNFVFSGFIGGRFYITRHLGIWVEVAYSGYGGNIGNIGLSWSF